MTDQRNDDGTVRHNLMTVPGYTPYCGSGHCKLSWPRSTFNGSQFTCQCGWVSEFPAAFIEEYRGQRQ